MDVWGGCYGRLELRLDVLSGTPNGNKLETCLKIRKSGSLWQNRRADGKRTNHLYLCLIASLKSLNALPFGRPKNMFIN